MFKYSECLNFSCKYFMFSVAHVLAMCIFVKRKFLNNLIIHKRDLYQKYNIYQLLLFK